MKTLKNKQIIAFIIDYFIIALIMVACCVSNLPDWFWKIEFEVATVPVSFYSFGAILITIPIFCRDLLFRNASLGKKIMRIKIVDFDGNMPKAKTVIKRGFLMNTVGFVLLFLKYDIQKWEIDVCKTKIVHSNQDRG